jgi:cytoskeletal protein RodZ
MDIQKHDNNSPNTIDLNNPNNKSVESNSHTSRVAPVKSPNKKKKWIIFGLGAIVLIAVIGFISYRYYLQRLAEENTKNNKIVIGDTTITQDDITKYTNALDENKKENPGVFYNSGSREIAINDLVTNAGLKQEAKEKNLALTADEYQKLFELPAGITDATPFLNQIK